MIPGEEVHIDLGPDAVKDFKAYLTERSPIKRGADCRTFCIFAVKGLPRIVGRGFCIRSM